MIKCDKFVADIACWPVFNGVRFQLSKIDLYKSHVP